MADSASGDENIDELILQTFLTESVELLNGIEADLLVIEADGAGFQESTINRVFRIGRAHV